MNVTIQGFEELNRRFKALENVAKKPVLEKALKARAEIIRDDAKSRAPRRTGALAADIFKGPSSLGADIYSSAVEVGTAKDVFYGYFQEFGTGTSFDAAAARALGYPGRSRSKIHNMKAQSFLVPAAKGTETQSIAAMVAALEAEIHKAETA